MRYIKFITTTITKSKSFEIDSLALESDQIIGRHLNWFTVFTGGLACDQFLPHWFEFRVLLVYKQHTKMHNLFRLNIMLCFITHLNIEKLFCAIYF